MSRRCEICFSECERSSSSSAQPASSSLYSSSVRGANPRDLGPELFIIDTSKTGTSTGSPQSCVTGSPLISFFFFVTTFRHFEKEIQKRNNLSQIPCLKKKNIATISYNMKGYFRFYTFIFLVSPYLAKYPYRPSPLEQFLNQFCDVYHTGYHPQEDLATFGY